ncbi:ATP-binding protein [Nocardioides sp. P5_C9_2]
MPDSHVPARVVVLAGPSGAGKSRLAERLGLPVLRLDDFYKDGDDPTLPRITDGANAGIVDWDHPDSWHLEDALTALTSLCRDGHAQVPVYEIAQNGRSGSRLLELGDARVFVAEGIFAPQVVSACASTGLLAAAYCVRQHPVVTFWRRLTRDLREHRKPPLVLVRRGLALLRDQRRVVAHAVELGCEPVTPDEAHDRLVTLVP